ncbi:hypothetical protein GCM10020331_055580 [Ectobacillus funiculus]
MTEQMKQEVNQCMFDYSFMFRFSFKRLVEIEREHELDEDHKKAIQQLEKKTYLLVQAIPSVLLKML